MCEFFLYQLNSVDHQEWWDRSPEAGPKVRAREAFGQSRPVLEVLCWQNSSLESPVSIAK